jgi:hypothetical protein
MKHLTILVPEIQNDIISIAALYEIFATANAYLEHRKAKIIQNSIGRYFEKSGF